MKNIQLLYTKYLEEMKYHPDIEIYTIEEFTSNFQNQLDGMQYIEVKKNNEISFIYYHLNQNVVSIPVYGYYAGNEEMMVRVFQQMASQVVKDESITFYVNLYAHDIECIKAYVMMQFGIQSEKGWSKLKDIDDISTNIEIKPLSKEQIKEEWNQVWDLTHCIITHLQASPVFYPGLEFTETVYRDFYLDHSTEVFAAYDQQRMVGIIEINLEENEFLMHKKSVNVGEIYVLPEYRKTGLSTRLLECVEKKAKNAGYDYMWLEHGTANPNARGFWNKYFNTYTYNLVREIKKD